MTRHPVDVQTTDTTLSGSVVRRRHYRSGTATSPYGDGRRTEYGDSFAVRRQQACRDAGRPYGNGGRVVQRRYRVSASPWLFGDSRRAETQGDRTATVGESFSDDAGFRPLRDCSATAGVQRRRGTVRQRWESRSATTPGFGLSETVWQQWYVRRRSGGVVVPYRDGGRAATAGWQALSCWQVLRCPR